jgi:TIR domain
MNGFGGDTEVVVVGDARPGPARRGAVVFISYAASDNHPPPDRKSAPGLVTHLHRHLHYMLVTQLSFTGVRLWRDRTELAPGDDWTEGIEQALREADILIAVLSGEYFRREWCIRELETFTGRSVGQLAGREGHLLRVDKHKLVAGSMPDWLWRIQPVTLYLDDPATGQDDPLFFDGEPRDREEYLRRVFALARAIKNLIDGMAPRIDAARPEMELDDPEPAPGEPDRWNGRTVFVAKPAQDLKAEYRLLVAELLDQGFKVVPPAAVDLPDTAEEARRQVTAGLAAVELVVHPVGARLGMAPHGSDQALVPLQLTLSAAEAAARPELKRWLWVPRVIPHGGAAAVADPLSRLEGAGVRPLPTDQIDCGGPAEFRANLKRALARRPAPPNGEAGRREVGAKSRCYVLHHAGDRALAAAIVKALRRDGQAADLPATDGTEREIMDLHRSRLAAATHVLLCWDQASQVWVESTADGLVEPDVRPSAVRIAVLAGAATAAKQEFVELGPGKLDSILDCTGRDAAAAVAEALRATARGAGG